MYCHLVPYTGVPGIPQHLLMTPTTHDSVTVQWTAPPPAGVDLLHYHVVVTPPPVSYSQARCNVTGTSVVITGLKHGTNYTVTVSAINCAGEGELSMPLRVKLVAEGTTPLCKLYPILTMVGEVV